MVYRSSKRTARDDDEATAYELQEGLNMGDDGKEAKYIRQSGIWRTVAIIAIIVSIGLFIANIVISRSGGASSDDVPVCGTGPGSVKRVIDISEPSHPGPFHDLTKQEIKNIIKFLHNDPQIKAKPIEQAKMTDSVIFMMDLFPANKKDVLAYLDGKRSQPNRQARVIVFRGDLDPPMVHEVVCGPLPDVSVCELIKSNQRRNPVEFSMRPVMPNEYEALYENLFRRVDEQIGDILRESYGMSFYDCTPPNCLKTYPSPMATNLTGDITFRRIWLWANYPVEYYSEAPVDLGLLANLDGSNPDKFHIDKVWYSNQFFESMDEFIEKYRTGSINKTKLSPPSLDPKESFSSLFRKGDPEPVEPQRPPTLVEPDGARYSLKNREVEYLGWEFNFRLSALSGPSLSNIRYKGKRIAYELSMSEIAVYYSAHNPLQRSTDYADSGALIGTHSKSLIPGGDCPDIATFINQTFSGQSVSEPVELERAICLFENNHGYPIRRHLSYSQYEGAYYGGMLDSALTLRSIFTVVNYDYVVDFIFHQTGALQVRVMSTGYILSAFYNDKEKPYGFRLHDNLIANIHHHMFNFKVDLDIEGTSNRYETLDIKPQSVNLRASPTVKYHQTMFDRTLYKKEKDALYKFNFDTPKYHIIHNNEKRTKYGEPKAYRIIMNGMSKQLIPENENNEPTISWARHQLVVTKRKEDEQLSSSPYAMFDSLNPVTNFTKYYEDNDDITDTDLVFWVTCGIHHIPHSEDLPITPTVGNHLSFLLVPYNYFPSCPSFASRDHIRINLKDPNNPKEGVTVDRNGYKDNQCKTPNLATQYEELLKQDPDIVIESRKHKGLF